MSIFRNLTGEEIESLRPLVLTRDYKSGECILEEGALVHTLYMICDGAVHVRRKTQGAELMLGRLNATDFFGEVNLFEEGPATASVKAVQPTHVALIPLRELRQFMAANPLTGYKILETITRELAHRLRNADSRLALSLYWRNLQAGDAHAPA